MKGRWYKEAQKCLTERAYFFACYEPKKLVKLFLHFINQMLFIAKHVLFVMRTLLEKQIVILSQAYMNLIHMTHVWASFKMWTLYGDCKIIRFPDIHSTSISMVQKEYLLNAVLSNFHIVDSYSNWSQLLLLEVLYIKTLSPKMDYNSAFITNFDKWFHFIYFNFLITQF